MRGTRNKRSMMLLIFAFVLLFIVGAAYAFTPGALEVHVRIAIYNDADDYPNIYYPPYTTGSALYVTIPLDTANEPDFAYCDGSIILDPNGNDRKIAVSD